MTPERIAEVCDGAADLLETDGWCRFMMHNNGHRCILGALNDLTGGPEYEPDLIEAVIAAADAQPESTRVATLTCWNDRQTSRRPVIRLLRRTARQQRGTA